LDTINVRDVLSRDTDSLWDILPNKFVMVFDSQETMEVTKKSTIFSSCYWDIVREYPNTILVPKHHLEFYLKGKPFTSKSHLNILNALYPSIVEAYNLYRPDMRNHLNRRIFEVNNESAYNRLSTKLYQYMTSIDILDVIEVSDNENILKAVEDCNLSEDGVDQLSNKVISIIKNDKSLDNNRLARALRYGILRDNQVVQSVAMRGYVTDVDSDLFMRPVTGCYVNGIRSIYESLVESRLGAKSLLYSEEPLRQTEYLSRRLQLLSMTVERIHYTDCGSQEYLEFLVQPDKYDSYGKLVSKSNLDILIGKYYLDPLDGTLKSIKGNETHLHNTWIKLRDPVAGCKHPDPHGICSVCFGDLSQNIQPGANVGHLCASAWGKIIAQLILSVKHVESSTNSRCVKIDNDNRDYLDTDIKRDKYYLRKNIVDNDYYLEVSKDAMPNLNDIIDVKGISYVDIARTTSIEEIKLFNATDYKIFPIQVDNMTGVFTAEFIEYLKVKKWTLNQRGNYIFDISEWNCNHPFISLSKKEFNNFELSKLIEKIITSRGLKESKKKERRERDESEAILRELVEVVNTKLKVNFAILSTIVYGTMVKDPSVFDARLPKAGEEKRAGILKETLPNRSLSGVFAFEVMAPEFVAPKSYFPLYRDNYVMDIFLTPEESMRSKGIDYTAPSVK